jgi:ubiquinone/menaquinone biosynthesis C-methylase UbiE
MMEKKMAVYDSIAKQYQKLDDLPTVHINVYTHLNLIGNFADKSILDLACGDGFTHESSSPMLKTCLEWTFLKK